MKEFADDNFKFGENGRKFSKQAENTVEKGEIARYEQLLLFPQCFQKTCDADMQKPGLVWERVKWKTLLFPESSTVFLSANSFINPFEHLSQGVNKRMVQSYVAYLKDDTRLISNPGLKVCSERCASCLEIYFNFFTKEPQNKVLTFPD